MRVLHLTSGWPGPDDPIRGCFIAEQVESLTRAGVACEVLAVDGRASRWNYLAAARALPAAVKKNKSIWCTPTTGCAASWRPGCARRRW